jgi:MFS family permease
LRTWQFSWYAATYLRPIWELTFNQGNTFIVLAAIARGVDQSWAFYLVPIMNAASFFGRIVPGPLADKIGSVTVYTGSAWCMAVVFAALWVPVSGQGGTIAFSILFGFFSGTLLALAPVIIAAVSDLRSYGLRMGLLYGFTGISCLFGSPAGGAIITASGYRAMQGFTAAIAVIAASCAVVIRYRIGGWAWKKV